MPLLDLDDAKAALNITVDTYDDELQDYIDGAIEAVEFICGSSSAQTVTEVVDVGGCEIPLSKTPVISVTSINGDSFGSTTLTNLHIDNEAGVIRSKVGRYAIRPDTVTVVYVAGRETAPAAMKQAAKVILKHQWSTQRGNAARRPSTEDSTYVSGLGYAVPNAALQMLNPNELGPAVR